MMERAFASSQPMLDLDLFDLLPSAVLVCEAPTGIIRRFNKRAAELWGRSPALGDFREKYCGAHRLYRPDGSLLSHIETPMAAALKDGTTTIDEEIIIERPDDSRITVSVNVAPLRGPDGVITGAVNVFQDISARKRADVLISGQKLVLEMIARGEALHAVLEALVHVLEQHSHGAALGSILLLDADGSHLRHGAAPGLPDSYRKVVDGIAIASDIGTSIHSARLGRSVVTGDIETSPGLATLRHLLLALDLRSVWSVPILSASGRALGMLRTYSRERRAPSPEEQQALELLASTAAIAIERQLADDARLVAERRKDEFLAMLAHELRNPLAPIRTAAELLNIGGSDREVVRRAHEIIERQVRNMARLLDDLLDVSRITRGAIELRRAPVMISQIAARAVDTVTPLVESRGHQLLTQVPQEPIVVEGDETRLEQVLINLLSNAAKYTQRGGRIELIVAAEGREVSLIVRDNGCGISPELLPHVFELFMQGERSSESHHDGLGVGLTIVQQLVQGHGGRISVHSDGIGQGSEFTVHLPRLEATNAA